MGVKKELFRFAVRTLAPRVTTASMRSHSRRKSAPSPSRRRTRPAAARGGGSGAVRYALTGLAAAAVALPVGVWVGNQLRERRA